METGSPVALSPKSTRRPDQLSPTAAIMREQKNRTLVSRATRTWRLHTEGQARENAARLPGLLVRHHLYEVKGSGVHLTSKAAD